MNLFRVLFFTLMMLFGQILSGQELSSSSDSVRIELRIEVQITELNCPVSAIKMFMASSEGDTTSFGLDENGGAAFLASDTIFQVKPDRTYKIWSIGFSPAFSEIDHSFSTHGISTNTILIKSYGLIHSCTFGRRFTELQFGKRITELTADHQESLGDWLLVLQENPCMRVEIRCTPAPGEKPKYCISRGEAIKNFLVEQGIAPERLSVRIDDSSTQLNSEVAKVELLILSFDFQRE